MASILIKGGRIFDGERFLFADLLTDGGKIAAIEPHIGEKADFVFDAGGKIVTPGLVDAHAHLSGISGPAYAFHAGMATLPFGVTAAADASAAFGDRAYLDTLGVKVVVFPSGIIRGDRMCFDEVERMLPRYGDRAVGIKVFFDTEVSPVSSIAPLREAVAYAEARGLRVMVHSSNPPAPMGELLAALRPGDILTHAFHGGRYTVADDGYSALSEAKGRGVLIDAGMAGHVHTDFAVMRGAIARGLAPDILSTDITHLSAYQRGGRYGLPLVMTVARDMGMAEAAVFRAVTASPAEALGMGEAWGRLAVGRAGDIAVLEMGDGGYRLTDRAGNTVEGERSYSTVLTVLNGQVVYRK